MGGWWRERESCIVLSNYGIVYIPSLFLLLHKINIGSVLQLFVNPFFLCVTPRFGPLVRFWMMMFEARHRYFKSVALQLGNFIKIAYSLAIRHQRLQFFYQLSGHTLVGEKIELGPGECSSRQDWTDQHSFQAATQVYC